MVPSGDAWIKMEQIQTSQVAKKSKRKKENLTQTQILASATQLSKHENSGKFKVKARQRTAMFLEREKATS